MHQCDSEQDGAAVEERPQAGSDLERQMIEELPHTETVPESIAEFKREEALVGQQPGVHGSVSEYERMKTIMGPMFPRRNEEVQAAAAAAATAANESGADGSDLGNANKSKDKKMKKKMNSKKKRKGGNGKHNRSSKTKKDGNDNSSNKGEETGGQAARDGWTRRGVWWWNFIVTQIIVNIYAFAIWKAGSRSVRCEATNASGLFTLRFGSDRIGCVGRVPLSAKRTEANDFLTARSDPQRIDETLRMYLTELSFPRSLPPSLPPPLPQSRLHHYRQHRHP